MKKRSRLGKGFIVIAFWVLGVAILMFTLAQVRDFAGIINDSGVVRGGTQTVAVEDGEWLELYAATATPA